MHYRRSESDWAACRVPREESVKNLRWLLVLLLFAVPYEEKALGGGDLACCGALGGAGKWGGRSQFSVCVPSASCNSASNTQVAVTYVDGAQSCPAGSYDCVVRAFSQCCGFDCSYYHDQCSAFSPSPSCCAGYCGPGAATPGPVLRPGPGTRLLPAERDPSAVLAARCTGGVVSELRVSDQVGARPTAPPEVAGAGPIERIQPVSAWLVTSSEA